MEQALHRPAAALDALLVRPMLGIARSGGTPSTWTEVPRPMVTVMIDLAGSIASSQGLLPGAWFGGIGDEVEHVTMSGTYACIDLKLTPLGAYRLAGVPLSELAGRIVALEDICGPRLADELLWRLRDAETWDVRFALLERFLAQRAAEGPQPAPFVEWAWQRIIGSGGRVRVADLAQEIGCSRRHLHARFSEQLGIAPKAAARLIRFHGVCAALSTNPGRWADLAAEAGYADQAHLNREFRQLAGTTPTGFLQTVAPAWAGTIS